MGDNHPPFLKSNMQRKIKWLRRENQNLFPKPFFIAIFSHVVTGCGQTCGQKYSKVFCVLLYNRKSTRLLFAIHKNKIKIPQKTVHFLRNFWSE